MIAMGVDQGKSTTEAVRTLGIKMNTTNLIINKFITAAQMEAEKERPWKAKESLTRAVGPIYRATF